ncbi:MAG TPA: hypothetical protein VEG67_00585 [Myxococcota bacterium]|nr:hypothetical protein [Myxococcota bacterium]
MSSWQSAAPIPLTGADCFLRAFDAEARRRNGASHLSQLVLRLGRGFELARFCDLVTQVSRANPLLRAPIRRPFGLLPPVYDTPRARFDAAPPVWVHESSSPRSERVPQVFFDRLNATQDLRRGELLRFDIVRYGGGAEGTDFAMTWAHLLFDGSGSEHFIEWLAACHRGERMPEDLSPAEGAGIASVTEGRGAAPPRGPRAQGLKARAYQARMAGFAARPPRSLAGPLRRTPQALCYEVETYGPEETSRSVERATQQAGFLTPVLFYLAAVIRAHHAVFRMRGLSAESYVVPVVANLRPKGARGAIFRSHVSMLWFQVFPEQVEDFATLLGILKDQRLARIREGFIENGAAAMNFARWAPSRLYARMAERILKGELASFFFAYTGDFLPGLAQFVGAEIRNGFHAAGVMASPGSAALLSLRDGRLNVGHVRQQDVFSAAELSAFRTQLHRDLLGVDGGR